MNLELSVDHRTRNAAHFQNTDPVHVLFYGNCQCYGLLRTLNLQLPYVASAIQCFDTCLSEVEFSEIVKKADIIITQPVRDDYRGKPHLSSTFVLQNRRPGCVVLFFESLHFDFYYFDTAYKNANGQKLSTPSDYHYNTLLTYYLQGKTVEEYVSECVQNENLQSREQLEQRANTSLAEMEQRFADLTTKYNQYENVVAVSVREYISENYKKTLLFYSVNHPSKWCLQTLAKKIQERLDLHTTLDYDTDPLAQPRCLLYRTLSRAVNFDLDTCSAELAGQNDYLQIAKLYYDAYNAIDLRTAVVD